MYIMSATKEADSNVLWYVFVCDALFQSNVLINFTFDVSNDRQAFCKGFRATRKVDE